MTGLLIGAFLLGVLCGVFVMVLWAIYVAGLGR